VGPLTLAATCAGISAQESTVQTVGQCTASTQTDPPAATRKTYLAILKTAPAKSVSRTTATVATSTPTCVIVEGNARSAEPTPKPLKIAPKPAEVDTPAPQDQIPAVVSKVDSDVAPTVVLTVAPTVVPAVVPAVAPTVVPAVEDIQPTVADDDAMFNWDDILQQPTSQDMFTDIPPISLGSPDSGLGYDMIGSEPSLSDIFNSEDDVAMSNFASDTTSDLDINSLSPLSDSLDFDTNEFLSDFLTF